MELELAQGELLSSCSQFKINSSQTSFTLSKAVSTREAFLKLQ